MLKSKIVEEIIDDGSVLLEKLITAEEHDSEFSMSRELMEQFMDEVITLRDD